MQESKVLAENRLKQESIDEGELVARKALAYAAQAWWARRQLEQGRGVCATVEAGRYSDYSSALMSPMMPHTLDKHEVAGARISC